MLKVKIKQLLLGLVMLNFIFADYFTGFEIGGFSVNAVISVLSVVLLSLLITLSFPQVVFKIPFSLRVFSIWMIISLFIGLINSQTFPNQVGYRFTTAIQQFLIWFLFITTLCVGVWLGKDEWVYKNFKRTAMLTSILWGFLIFLPGNAFDTRSLAALLALLFSVSYALFRKERKNKWLFLSLFIFAAIVLTSARMATMACVVAIVAIELSDFRFLNSLSWRKLIPILIILVLLISLVYLYPPMLNRFLDIFNSAKSLLLESDAVSEGELIAVTQGRARVWPLLFEKALEKPIFGHGIGTASAYSFYFSNNTRFTHPHNEYLRFFFDTGLLGLLLLLVGLLSIGRKFSKSIRLRNIRLNEKSFMGIGALGVMLSLFLTDNVGIYSFFMAPLGFILGLALADTSNIDKKLADRLEPLDALDQSND